MKYKGIPIHEIIVYKHPLVYLSLVKDLLIDLLFWFKDFVVRRFLLIVSLITIYALVTHVPQLHVPFESILAH